MLACLEPVTPETTPAVLPDDVPAAIPAKPCPATALDGSSPHFAPAPVVAPVSKVTSNAVPNTKTTWEKTVTQLRTVTTLHELCPINAPLANRNATSVACSQPTSARIALCQ